MTISSLRTTVIIAHHNYEAYLKDAIVSCLAQTVLPTRVIVVDDHSDKPEKVIEIVENFAQDSIQLILLDETVGPSLARNIAIEQTIQDTDIYFILDADDMMYPTKIEECLKGFEVSSQIGVVYADYDIYDVHKKTVVRQYKEPYNFLRLHQECIVHSGSAIRKEALVSVKDQFGYYDENMRTCEDFDLWLRIGSNWMISHIPKSLTLVRNHNYNSTNTVNKEIWQQNWNRINQKLNVKNN